MGKAEITMTLAEFDELREKLRAAHAEIGQLEGELEAAQAADPSGRVPVLIGALKAALPIVQFACGNLDPRTITRWPYPDVLQLATLLANAPGMPHNARELAVELRAFAQETQTIERDRHARGIYADGPDPLDMILLKQIAAGDHQRIEILREAGLLTAKVTEEGVEAIRDAGLVDTDEAEGAVADATDSA